MRALVACIVALSIPLQGLASTFMMHCGTGPTHAQHAAQPSMQHTHTGHDGTAAEFAGATAVNDGHAASHMHAQTVHKVDMDDESPSADRGSCAVCCAAVITQATLAVASDACSEHPLPLVLAATPERNPGGIERPPRLAR